MEGRTSAGKSDIAWRGDAENMTMQMQTDSKTGPTLERALPDPGMCRVNPINDTVAECLVDHPWDCPWALSFGDGCLCMRSRENSVAAPTNEIHGVMPYRSGRGETTAGRPRDNGA
jgi:hypothetical protein